MSRAAGPNKQVFDLEGPDRQGGAELAAAQAGFRAALAGTDCHQRPLAIDVDDRVGVRQLRGGCHVAGIRRAASSALLGC